MLLSVSATTRDPWSVLPRFSVTEPPSSWNRYDPQARGAVRPNHFEKGMVAPVDVYTHRADGGIEEDFSLRSGGFDATVRHFTVRDTIVPGTNNASWRVHILWPISLPFLVLYTDPDYRYVMFGENDRQLGWVFSRTATIDDADYHALLARFAALGYDTSRFRKVIQLPEQIGQAGYWNDGIH
jgi:apolipoprotein D and lipocalin family protein